MPWTLLRVSAQDVSDEHLCMVWRSILRLSLAGSEHESPAEKSPAVYLRPAEVPDTPKSPPAPPTRLSGKLIVVSKPNERSPIP